MNLSDWPTFLQYFMELHGPQPHLMGNGLWPSFPCPILGFDGTFLSTDRSDSLLSHRSLGSNTPDLRERISPTLLYSMNILSVPIMSLLRALATVIQLMPRHHIPRDISFPEISIWITQTPNSFFLFFHTHHSMNRSLTTARLFKIFRLLMNPKMYV